MAKDKNTSGNKNLIKALANEESHRLLKGQKRISEDTKKGMRKTKDSRWAHLEDN